MAPEENDGVSFVFRLNRSTTPFDYRVSELLVIWRNAPTTAITSLGLVCIKCSTFFPLPSHPGRHRCPRLNPLEGHRSCEVSQTLPAFLQFPRGLSSRRPGHGRCFIINGMLCVLRIHPVRFSVRKGGTMDGYPTKCNASFKYL